ncbi:aspartate aminotransferase family protein [Cytobacillus gottheilii]|uniref:aspartate aminotransferase family protein n=1 Tax=Cytobacillus gottheilii TaxID=859144 RepID=UPI0009BAEE2E|nr:aspartate aminotransferase family protein [Cytobacillus gottheilii]
MDPSYLIKPLLDETYPLIDYGKGVYLYDQDGKDYLDACSGAITANIGHGVKEIISAAAKQAEKVSFVYRSQFSSEAAEQLAKKIAQCAYGDLNWSFFVNSGSEATETAMKIAIQYWQEQGIYTKTKILSRWISYHGITLGALSLSGHRGRRSRFMPLLEDSPVLPPPYCYRCPFHEEQGSCQYSCAHELDLIIKRMGAEHIAAFIAEPIVGAAGAALTPPKEYYKIIKKICEKHGILFIADEVMTGFGRTGKMFAAEHWDTAPDIVALGKGMGAGYTAIAAALVSDHVMEPILKGSKSIMSGHTLSANPQSCAVSLAVLEYIEKHNLVKQAEEKGVYLKDLLQKLQSSFPVIGDIRGKGLMLGLEFVQDPIKKTVFPRAMQFTQRLISAAQINGLLLYPAGAGEDGIHGDAILIAPPLTITEEEMNELGNRLEKTLQVLMNDDSLTREEGA